MIEYLYKEGDEACSKEPLKVRLDGRNVGEIRKADGGYQYIPVGAFKGSYGPVLKTVTAVQMSLHDREEE